MRFFDRVKFYRIDLDADPIYVPPGFEVVEHRKGGIVDWTPDRPQIELFLTQEQRRGIADGSAVFEELRVLEGIIVNANALDYLLNNIIRKPWIIPEEWKHVDMHRSKHILFWGTQYRYEGALCVRSLE